MGQTVRLKRILIALTLPMLGLVIAGPAHAMLPEEIPAPGVTQALREVKLSLTVAGRVEGLFVKEGDRVRRGDLLVHLDRTAEDLEVKRRRLMLEDQSRLEELRQKEKTLIDQVGSARELFKAGGLSRKQLEDEELAMRAVIAERQMLEVTKKREEVEVGLSQEAFERRHLRAPFDGVVTKVGYRVGESVAAHEPVVVLVDVSKVRFMSAVAPVAAARIRHGQSIVVQLGIGTQTIDRKARVVFVAPTTDPSSGLIEVISEFDNFDGSVKPGITGRLMLGPVPIPSQPTPVGDRLPAKRM